MKVLVTGATGAIGPRIVDALHQSGHAVRALSIDAPAEGMFPEGVECLRGDITDPETVEAAMNGVDAVVHMAALLHIIDPTQEMLGEYERINVHGTSTVVGAAVKAGVRRIVFFSTIAVYGRSDGQKLDEQSPARPETIYARTKLAAEEIVLHAKGGDGRPLGVVLRLGAVYGSRIKGNYKRFVHALHRRWFVPIGPGLNRRTLVYDKDVGLAASCAVTQPALEGRVFNVTDGSLHTLQEIIRCICFALGRTPPRLYVPVVVARGLVAVVEKAFRSCGMKSPVSQETIDKYTEDSAVDGGLFQKEAGFVPRYALVDGWRETIQEMRDDHAL